MAKDKKISQVSIADKVVGDELLPFAKNGENGAVSTGKIIEKAKQDVDEKLKDVEAAKLKKPVKIWGREFDGSKDISGDINLDDNSIINADRILFLGGQYLDGSKVDDIEYNTLRLEGVTKAADDNNVIKKLQFSDRTEAVYKEITPEMYNGTARLSFGYGFRVGKAMPGVSINFDTDYIATKESVNNLKILVDDIELAQNQDLAKITALSGKLNGIDNVKDFVNSSIATSTAEFKGTHNSLEELQIIAADANDYGFVVSKDAEGNTVYNRYKYVEGQGWVFEYSLNNSSFTAAQWAAIQSGITQPLVEKLRNEVATKNELDVVETLAESVNTGLGETIQRVSSLESGLQADKENLKNFKQHVEDDFVKDADYNKDKETLTTEIMKKGDKTWVEQKISDTLNSSPAIVEAVTDLKNRLNDDNDIATAVQKQLSEKQTLLTDSADITVKGSELSLTEQAKRAVFDDMWKAAFGEFGVVDHTHKEGGKDAPYYGNKLWMTYEEAQAVMAAGPICSDSASHQYAYKKNRTNVPPTIGNGALIDLTRIIYLNDSIQVLNLACDGLGAKGMKLDTLTSVSYFQQSKSLREILGVLDIYDCAERGNGWILYDLQSLESIQLKNLRHNIIITNVPNLNAESVKYLLQNASNTTAVTVTFKGTSSSVYAKITEGEGEWNGILELAQSKNISIASA